jgi:hypothetical protein
MHRTERDCRPGASQSDHEPKSHAKGEGIPQVPSGRSVPPRAEQKLQLEPFHVPPSVVQLALLSSVPTQLVINEPDVR